MKKRKFLSVVLLLLMAINNACSQDLQLNKLEYFETQGVNVLVYNNVFNGGFNDEKNAGIELPPWGENIARWRCKAFQYSGTVGPCSRNI